MILAAKITKFLETLAIRATGRHRHLADPRHVQNLSDSSSQRIKRPQLSTELQCDIEHATFNLYIPGQTDARPHLSLLLLARHARFISQYCRINSPWSKVTIKKWGTV
jgi:hypothetical protein